MEQSYLLKVLRFLYRVHKVTPLALQDIYLQIGKEVVDEEAHVLSQKHRLPKVWITRVMLRASNLASPDVLKVELNSLNGEQKSEESIVLFYNIW